MPPNEDTMYNSNRPLQDPARPSVQEQQQQQPATGPILDYTPLTLCHFDLPAGYLLAYIVRKCVLPSDRETLTDIQLWSFYVFLPLLSWAFFNWLSKPENRRSLYDGTFVYLCQRKVLSLFNRARAFLSSIPAEVFFIIPFLGLMIWLASQPLVCRFDYLEPQLVEKTTVVYCESTLAAWIRHMHSSFVASVWRWISLPW
ncbi:hypothetical protein F5Y16DRAFT_375194 [Xylariaceae sp. FL0255]|nr:hypothetical protein F5Y16DRAFT_375194 [Xylariaceae sp. FL0255]